MRTDNNRIYGTKPAPEEETPAQSGDLSTRRMARTEKATSNPYDTKCLHLPSCFNIAASAADRQRWHGESILPRTSHRSDHHDWTVLKPAVRAIATFPEYYRL